MRRLALTIFALSVCLAPTRAQDNENDFGARRARAMDRGIAWLEKQQQADGSWNYDDKPFKIEGLEHMVSGCTALACYALLKAGVDPTDAKIEKGFQFFRKAPLEQTYSVGCILLAIEARYNWEPPFYEEKQADGTHEKGPGPRKVPPPGADMDLARKCVAFLVKELREKIRKIDADFKGKKAGATNGAGHTEKDERDAAAHDASEKAFKTTEKQKPHTLHARGWAYQHGGEGLEEWKTRTTGSMTTSGLAAVLVCKGQLDGTPGFEKQREAVDTAIRDGCAWIAANFAVEGNPNVAPGAAQHH